MEELTLQAAEALKKRGFTVRLAETAAEAREMALSMIPPAESVGVGGSVTIRDLNLIAPLETRGSKIYWHWLPGAAAEETFEGARQADIYLTSANAITRDGRLVCMDGRGNRIASIVQGPRRVLLVVGQQKVVDGGLNAAIARIHAQACPPNASRLGLRTPCALTGVCRQEACGDDCMCRVIVALEHPPTRREISVILTGEALGY